MPFTRTLYIKIVWRRQIELIVSRGVFPLSHRLPECRKNSHCVVYVNSDSSGGLLGGWVRYTYVPYLLVGETGIEVEGAPFIDFINNIIPLANIITTGEWLEIELEDPDGHQTQYEREIFDSIGAGPVGLEHIRKRSYRLADKLTNLDQLRQEFERATETGEQEIIGNDLTGALARTNHDLLAVMPELFYSGPRYSGCPARREPGRSKGQTCCDYIERYGGCSNLT